MFGFLRRRGERWVKAQLSPYLDGRLNPEDRVKVESHLRGCPACREELDSLRATIETLRHLVQVDLPRSFAIPALKPGLGVSPPRPAAFPRLRLATAVVAALLVLLVAGDTLGLFLKPDIPAPQPLTAPALAPIPVPQAAPPPSALSPAEPIIPPVPAPIPAPAPLGTPRPPEKAEPKGVEALRQKAAEQALPVAPTPAPGVPVAPGVEAVPAPPVATPVSPVGAAGPAGPSPTPAPKLPETEKAPDIPIQPAAPAPEALAAPPPLPTKAGYAWPIKQLEIGLGVIVLLLGLATAYAWHQGKRKNERKETIQ